MSTRSELTAEIVALGYPQSIASRLNVATMLDIIEDRFYNRSFA